MSRFEEKVSEWSDSEFLNYVEAHSKTPRALFSKEHVNRFRKLAGKQEIDGSWDFIAMHNFDIVEDMKRAKERVAPVA